MIATIPSELKRNAYKTQISPEDLFKTEDIFQLTQNLSFFLGQNEMQTLLTKNFMRTVSMCLQV